MDWIALGAIATCVVAAGIVFAIWQVWETRRGRNAQLAASLFQELRSSASKETLRLIYGAIYEDGMLKHKESSQPLTEVEESKVGDMLDKIELLGVSVAHGILDKDLATDLFRGHPVRCWYILSDYIEDRAKERGYFGGYVKDFAKRSIKRQINCIPRDQWTTLKIDVMPSENVVEKLLEDSRLLSRCEQRIAFSKRLVKSIFVKRLRKKCVFLSFLARHYSRCPLKQRKAQCLKKPSCKS